jgi:general secretion pathway protein C
MLISRHPISFRIVEIGFITAAAFLIADIVSLLIEQRLDVPLLASYSAGPQNPPNEQRSARTLMTSVMQRGVLGPASEGEERQAGRRPVSQKVRLLGTVVGEPSFAILEDVTTLQQGLYRMHERIPGAGHIAAIERNRITIASGVSREILEVGQEEPVLSKAAEPESVPDTFARRVVLDRQLVQSGYDNLTTLMTQGRVAPSVANGKSNGFSIRDIAKGSLFERVGLRNNDILQRINGVEVKDPETLFKMFLSLKDESSIAVDVLRGGQVETYAYEIR